MKQNLICKKPVACFRRWENKSYSVFTSLKATVKVGIISARYLMLTTPALTFAQQPDTVAVGKNIEMDEVVISSPMAASTYSEVTRAVTVITNEEFSQLPVTTLQELLENVPSIDIRNRGAHGVQADLMIRGGSFDQVLILLNGINITDPQTGHHNLNIPIDLESIERIEILQGPGARVYGPGTFSGAINIITTPQNESYTRLAAKAGENGLLKTSASAAIEANKTNFFVAASTAKSDGYINNTDFNTYNIFTHAKVAGDKSSLDIQTGYQDKAFGAQSFYTPKFPEQFEKTRTLFSSASFTKNIQGISVSSSAYIRNHTDRFELFRYDYPEWYGGHNYHNTWVWGSKLQLSSLNKLGRSRAGAEFKNERIYSNVLGQPLSSPKQIRGFTDTSYTHGAKRGTFNIYADHTFYLNRLTISTGGLIAQSNRYGTSWSIGIDASLRIAKQTSMLASFNNAIRFPTFTDLYYAGPTNQGNPNLLPEKADNYEIGIKHSGKMLRANISLFHRKSKDVIDWVKNPGDEQWITMNHTRLNTTGIECFIQISTRKLIPIINHISAGYHYMQSDKTSDNLLSYYALDYLKHKGTFGINHSVWRNLSISWSTIFQSRAGSYTSYPSELEESYEPFLLINMRTAWNGKKFNAYVDVHNLTNKDYLDIGNIQQPGRWISLGINYLIQ